MCSRFASAADKVKAALAALALTSPLTSPATLAADSSPAGEPGAGTKLLRYPDVHEDLVVFVYGGDLWSVPAGGGLARRLTAHPGLESFPKFSPDGRFIAFTGQYDGDEQVYVMPSEGGEPRRLTAYPAWGPLPSRWGSDNQVAGWTPDGSAIVFRSWRQESSIIDSRLYTVAVSGGMPSSLPMRRAGSGAFSPDGRQILFSPQSRDFRTWKHYRGGWAQELWIYDLAGRARNVTNHEATDRDPIWNKRGIFFVSDRDGRLNLYRMAHDGTGIERLTNHAHDVRWASGDSSGNVVYELRGGLRLYSADGSDAAIVVRVPDDGIHMRPRVVDVGDRIEDFDLRADGRRVLVTARGDVFSVPVGDGVTRNLTRSDTHERLAAWSPDGRSVAYVSDASGEEEIWLTRDAAAAEPRQVTRDNRFRLYRLAWSPDGQRLAAGDHRGRLYVVDAAVGDVQPIGETGAWYRQDFAWSPDGRWLAWSSLEPSFMTSVFVWSEDAGARRVTSALSNEFSPAWHSSGDYLYFLGDRALEPQMGSYEWNYAVDRETVVLGIALRPGVPNPFAATDGNDDDENDATSAPAEAQVRIDFDGLESRVFRVPLEADNFAWLGARGDDLLLVKTDAFYLGREPGRPPQLVGYSIDKQEERVVAREILGGTSSQDVVGTIGQVGIAVNAPKVLVKHADSGLEVHDLDSGKKQKVASNLRKRVDPRREWQTVFDEVWRRFRDFFYVSNMHGFDWPAIGEQYRSLLPHLSHRSDLNYLVGEMIAELDVGHAYVFGGDTWVPPRPPAMLIGASFEFDRAVGRYRIARILAGDNSDPLYRSPLTEVGVDVAEGDYLLAVNGVELDQTQNPYDLLREQAGAVIELLVSATPDRADGRTARVETRDSEQPLHYYRQVTGNRETVERLSDGRIGYVHLPDMGPAGLREFIRSYYGQIRKDALIVDVRGNGGGNVSQMILERLFRKPYSLGYVQGERSPRVYPWGMGGSRVFTGEIAVIADETTLSDGEAFTWTFQQAGRGPVIGARTWGGVIGTDDTGATVDGGNLRVPQFALADINGNWVVEGTGVIPDIPVENSPEAFAEGRDPQLERAVAELLRVLGTSHPGQLATPAPGPDKRSLRERSGQ